MKSQQHEWLSPSEVGEMLGLGRTRTYELIKEELPAVRIGRLVKINRQDIKDWLEANKTTPKD